MKGYSRKEDVYTVQNNQKEKTENNFSEPKEKNDIGIDNKINQFHPEEPMKTKKKKRRIIMPDISKTKSDIFESTPKVKRERNLHFNIPCGLSPPDFSALKISKFRENEDENVQ